MYTIGRRGKHVCNRTLALDLATPAVRTIAQGAEAATTVLILVHTTNSTIGSFFIFGPLTLPTKASPHLLLAIRIRRGRTSHKMVTASERLELAPRLNPARTSPVTPLMLNVPLDGVLGMHETLLKCHAASNLAVRFFLGF